MGHLAQVTNGGALDRSPGPSGAPSSMDSAICWKPTTSVAAPGADVAAPTSAAAASHGHRIVVGAVVGVCWGGSLAAAHVVDGRGGGG